MFSKRRNHKRKELFRRNTTASRKFQLVSIIIVLLQSFSFSLALDENICADKPFGSTIEDLTDCTSYFECLFGQLEHQTCPTGEKFDVKTESCVVGKCPPCKCDTETTTPSPTPTTEEPTSTTTESTESSSISTETSSVSTEVTSSPGTLPSSPGTGCSNEPYCQASDLDGTFYRDRNDCGKYYVCRKGVAVAYSCKYGMYFDEVINACNFASLVSCSPSTNENCTPKPTEPSTTTPLTEPPTTITTESTSTVATSSPGSECSNEPYCQATEHGTYHRDRIDCNKYYVCRNGDAVAHTCDRGMYFDEVHKVCNFADLVPCSPIISENCTPKPTQCSTEPNCKLLENFSFHRDKKDCRKYYVCIDGSSTLLLCPTGQYFDDADNEKKCKLESDVKCSSSVDENCEPKPTSTTVTKPSCPPVPDCKVEPQGTIYRDPRDCAKFYFCRNGIAVARSCSRGKLFDLNSNACIMSSLVDCTPDENCSPIEASPTPTLTTTSTPTPGPRPTSTTIMVPNGQVDPNVTDCLNQPNGTVFRHSVHCSVFYVCRNQKAVKHSCPYHQWFDDQVVVCNFRNLVDCPSGMD